MKEKRADDLAFKVLQESELFGELDESTTKNFIAECDFVSWKKGDFIDHENAQKHLYVLLEGRLKITQIDPTTGRSITLFLLSSGDIFDIFTLLDGEEHVVFPVALDKVMTLCIDLEKARQWLCNHPELNHRFLPYMGKLMRHLEDFSQSLVFEDTLTRLSKLILKHALPKKSYEDHYPVKLIHNLSHESLAEMIGSVRSVVSSQIHKLKEEEIILSRRGHLAIKNLEKLIHKSDHFEACISQEKTKKNKG